jgi:hypothetical protein
MAYDGSMMDVVLISFDIFTKNHDLYMDGHRLQQPERQPL